MAYENEFDFQETSKAIQEDLLLNATDITSAELLESADGVKVPVIKEVDGIPKIRRVTIGVLTEDVTAAATQARTQATAAQQSASEATLAANEAANAASSAREAVSELTDTVSDMESRLSDYYATLDEQVQIKLQALAQMAVSGTLDIAVRPYQLMEDVMDITGWTGTYEQFCRAIISTGGGTAISVDDAMSLTSENPVQNKVIATTLAGKQDTLEFLTSQDINTIINL